MPHIVRAITNPTKSHVGGNASISSCMIHTSMIIRTKPQATAAIMVATTQSIKSLGGDFFFSSSMIHTSIIRCIPYRVSITPHTAIPIKNHVGGNASISSCIIYIPMIIRTNPIHANVISIEAAHPI